MIHNQSSNQTCGACEDTGLVVLGGTYQIGTRVMQPRTAGCLWCEAGTAKFRLHPGLPAEYGVDDFDAPIPEPDLTNPRVRAACEAGFQEWKRGFRAMQRDSTLRAKELREGGAA